VYSTFETEEAAEKSSLVLDMQESVADDELLSAVFSGIFCSGSDSLIEWSQLELSVDVQQIDSSVLFDDERSTISMDSCGAKQMCGLEILLKFTFLGRRLNLAFFNYCFCKQVVTP
jgi:hypothetical protein